MTIYTIIPDNTPEEEVVLYHLRGNAISRADMINYLTTSIWWPALDGEAVDESGREISYYHTFSDAEIESTYNTVFADEIYYNSR